jgi:hypothetical protein
MAIMLTKRIAMALVALSVVGLCQNATSAQGGWRQWEIHFLDGNSVEASPLQMRVDGRFTRSMDPKEPGFARSKIDYLAASAKQLPPTPTGTFKQDLIVMLDGSRSFGRVIFRKVKFSEGTIEQNGKKMTLENVAYVKFSRPIKKKAYRKRRP